MTPMHPVEELVRLGLEPDGMRSPRAQELLSELEARDIEREKGANPVAFLLKRFDFTACPFEVGVEQHLFKWEECLLSWWPDGTEARWEYDRPTEPVADFTRAVYVSEAVAIRRRIEPRELRYAFSVSERSAMREPEWLAKSLPEVFRRQCGALPTVLSERETFYRIHPDRRPPE
jgi:hypothetical protein